MRNHESLTKLKSGNPHKWADDSAIRRNCVEFTKRRNALKKKHNQRLAKNLEWCGHEIQMIYSLELPRLFKAMFESQKLTLKY